MQILDGFIKDFNPDEAYLRRIAFYHREIYAALVGKDRKRALQNIEEHLTTVYEHLA